MKFSRCLNKFWFDCTLGPYRRHVRRVCEGCVSSLILTPSAPPPALILAVLLHIVGPGKTSNTLTEFTEVHFSIMVLIQFFHDLLNILWIHFILRQT